MGRDYGGDPQGQQTAPVHTGIPGWNGYGRYRLAQLGAQKCAV